MQVALLKQQIKQLKSVQLSKQTTGAFRAYCSNIYTVIQVDITTILQSISKIEQKTWPPRGGKTNKTRSFATKLQGRSKTEKPE